MTAAFYNPDMRALQQMSMSCKAASVDEARDWLSGLGRPTLEQMASIAKAVLIEHTAGMEQLVLGRAAEVRHELFGNRVIPMAPIEVSNACASDCIFCGWRTSNSAMKRLRMPADLVMLQVEYLLNLGISHIEFVSGDDIIVVRDLLPELIRKTRALMDARDIDGKISFCSLALTEAQYVTLREAGADTMIVWQETYDPEIFRQHIVGGPKAYGISDAWRPVKGGDGCRFRIESQERAMRAGLEVALGSMLGLNPDFLTEFLAVVEHTWYLGDTYGASIDRPLIIGMPIWNAITTPETDRRPREVRDLVSFFPAITAMYLLANPSRSTWVFPNCRVPLQTQIEAARVAGVFSSTEVKLGPGGYLPSIIREADARGEDTSQLRKRVATMLRDAGEDVETIERSLDAREQFLHHYHAHETYRKEMERAGLEICHSAYLRSCAKVASGN